MPVFSPRHNLREMFTPPLSTKANPGNVRWSSKPLTKSSNSIKLSGDFNTPKTPCRQRTQQTPRPQWSLPRAHYTYSDSPSSDSETSDVNDDNVTGNNGGNVSDALSLGFTDSDKENISFQYNINSQQHEEITKPTTITTDQHLKQPVVSAADTSREQQLAQKCYDSAMEILGSDSISAISGGSVTSSNKSASDDLVRSSCEGRECVALPDEPEFMNDNVSMTSSVEPSASVEEENEPQHSSSKVAEAQSPNESMTSSDYNREGEDTLSPLPQCNDTVVRSPILSVAHSNFAPTEASSVAASSVVTDLFAALRTNCSTVCGGENDDEDTTAEKCHLSPIHPREACLTAERKKWIHKTLLSKREYTPYQTKEREECCKNKDSHELTTVRKKWIEETLLTNPEQEMVRKLSPKQIHSSFLASALTAAGNELFAQPKWHVEEPFSDEARDDSTVASSMESPQQCHQQLDSSFLASALVATNMLLTPPRRERYSSKPSRPRMSIGATPLPFASPFSPSSAASSAFTETASNIILHAIKQLTPKQVSAISKQNKQKQKTTTPSRKSDLLSIVAEMDYFDTVGSHASKYDDRSQYNPTKLVERVEKLEQLITGQYNRGSDDHQEEINELRRQLDNERQLVEEANQRASMFMSNMNASQELHSDIESQLRERIQSLKVEVCCLRESQKQFASDQEKTTTEIVLESEMSSSELDDLRRENIGLLEKQKTAEMNHSECKKNNEVLRSQLLALSNERSEKEQLLTSAVDNLRSVSESFSSINQKLEEEVNTKKDEVTCMQRSLELMSCELIESTNEVKDLRSENARLHDELKRMKAGKTWLFS
ncbi:hypothetical protein QTG54_016757 [Skeletonema marinoi]|uniref:Uncharacterized protein n=1 Tax=Skeletonema marinoi TaxID=267567 RepID=A0AAD8XS96_9STRA|nr:hypothetical protein QTG54_016757 [Skeletonema marinoi]